MSSVRVRQLLGKYRVERRLAQGGYATVYQAFDTIEGIPVALKVPHPHFISRKALDIFRQEVRVNARLDHPNILPIKNAGFVDDVFVIAYPLGTGTLGDRLRKRLSRRRALHYAEQMLEAVAFAHAKRIAHLDLKPENFILFDRDRLRLADFGIARVALRTLSTSPLGTVGYTAPEQAMGKPSLRSDVFALGVILYRMFSGELLEWPYEWPPPGHDRLLKSLHPQFIALIRRAMAVDHRERLADARQVLDAFRRVKSRALIPRGRGAAGPARLKAASNGRMPRDWKEVRIGEFMRRYRSSLDVRCTCEHCGEPVSEVMQCCPWCGSKRDKHRDETTFPCQCPRCRRGMKLDWRFCPWCYGSAVGPLSTRRFTDRRYAVKCSKRACGGPLMPFMRYCPWCRTKVKRTWPIPAPHGHDDGGDRCGHCGHGVLPEFWAFCPWCARGLR